MEATSFETGENWEIYKDAFEPQPSGKILRAWERAPVTSHAPRLHGQKIWKKRGGLRGEQENKENYNEAFMELEKEGAGARKKPRVLGIKEDISRAKWHEGKDERETWDENLMVASGSPRKNALGTPNKLQVVPRKRTNANLVITPRKSSRQTVLGEKGQALNMELPLSPAKDKEVNSSPIRKRKIARKSMRKSMMPVENFQRFDEEKHHRRHTSLVFDFEMATGEKEMESMQKLEKSPKKTPKRQSLRRSMRGRVSEPVQVLEKVLTRDDKKRTSYTGFNSASLREGTVKSQAGAMEIDHIQNASPKKDKHQGTAHSPIKKPTKEQDMSLTAPLIEPLHTKSESAQTQAEDIPTQKTTKGAKQKRTSSRRSTRSSDRLELESVVKKPLLVESTEVTTSTIPTTNSQDLASLEPSQKTNDILKSTPIPAPDLDLEDTVQDAAGEEMVECQEELSNAEVSAPIKEINHIVEELLEQSVTSNDNSRSIESQAPNGECSDELPANMYRQQAFRDFEDIQPANESRTTHVAPLEEGTPDDEDMDDSMSDLPELLLESTDSVINLGLSGLNESFNNNTNEMQIATESEPIDDPESFDSMQVNSLHTDNQSDESNHGVTSAESTAAFATTSEADDTFSTNFTSSFENDDTDILRQFLTRVKADKAAKAAAPAPKKRKSLPHSPLRIPLGDIMNAEASSPVQTPRDDLELGAPETASPSRKSRATTPPSTEEVDAEARSIRRSGRTRPPVLKIPLPAPSSIPVRRLGGQDDTNVTLKQSVEKELAALTRVNTRKNKAGAVFPDVLLARKADAKENPAKRQKELKEMFEEKLRREKKAKGKPKKSVVWAEEIAQYQTLERKEKKTMESRKVNKNGERIVDGSKTEEKGKVAEAKDKKGRVKTHTSSSSRPSKITTGIPTASGTPARKKRVVKP
ncbi:uncharacterized protein EAF01_002198 [Botrytis porri]|uniref:Uncharacterized protein n=1 Tax=Botrytis porri TaxID=87229 RepID=A0A4Z1L2L8_9HELO|nr:uncharacterized protein EAF01_002198 [Botrytis porri]KAF7910688.1 hypothetical protein EAF01_002198 [Botrytis porri]TGO91045.1 hypothetical protein BPOR_0041g00080 [Botrytis porri]